MAVIRSENMLTGEPIAGWSGRFFHSENMTFGYWDVAADAADLHVHAHPQEEVFHIVEGALVVSVDGEECRVEAGEAVVIPADVPHSARVVGACRAIVADYPVRHNLPGGPPSSSELGLS